MLRLSTELANAQSQYADYYVLEPESEQEEQESGIQSFQTDRLASQSSLDSTDAPTVTPTPMSPDRIAEVSADNVNEAKSFTSDQPAEIRIKRTSSGKSPSKIPRYVGNSEDARAAHISYYMSLKRGQKSPGGSQAKFFIQVQDSQNPYAHLMPSDILSRKKHYGSQSTVDSEFDNVFDDYAQPVDRIDDGNGFHAQLGEMVTLHLENQSLAPSVTRTEQELLSERSSLSSLTDQAVTPNPIYQTIDQELESTRTFVDELTDNLSSLDNRVPQSPPPPAVPPRFEPGSVLPPPVPPVPKSNQRDTVRTESNFTSYLTETEVHSEQQPQVSSKEENTDKTALAQIGIHSWMWNDNSGVYRTLLAMQLITFCIRSDNMFQSENTVSC